MRVASTEDTANHIYYITASAADNPRNTTSIIGAGGGAWGRTRFPQTGYTGYDIDDTAYSDVDNRAGDMILQQTEIDCGASGNVNRTASCAARRVGIASDNWNMIKSRKQTGDAQEGAG